MGANTISKFDDVTIQKLFGHEAAEDEDKTRLKEYYFKSQVYDQITSDLPLRILVGHKGIGKSALFTVAMYEDNENNAIAILIRPDDVVEINAEGNDLLADIRDWKTGLIRIISEKTIEAMELGEEAKTDAMVAAGKMLNFVQSVLPIVKKYVNNVVCNKMLVRQFLDKHKILVYIDDLDRGWSANKLGIGRMSALMNALRDMSKEHPGLLFRVALRSDVYYLVRTSDESTDKIEGSVVWHLWTNHEILAMLVKRIESYFGRLKTESELMGLQQKDMAYLLDTVMEHRFLGDGHWQNAPIYRVLMSLIRKRPRDLVKLCTLAAQDAFKDGQSVISTTNWRNIFEQYSQGRLQDTINEFRSELPDIERLLLNMKPNKKERTTRQGYSYTTDELQQKLKNIEQQGQFFFYGGRLAKPKNLINFMYKIGFLTARKGKGGDDGTIVRKYFEENKYLASDMAEFGFDWEIHPAYRWALQPDDPRRSIYKELELTADDK